VPVALLPRCATTSCCLVGTPGDGVGKTACFTCFRGAWEMGAVCAGLPPRQSTDPSPSVGAAPGCCWPRALPQATPVRPLSAAAPAVFPSPYPLGVEGKAGALDAVAAAAAALRCG